MKKIALFTALVLLLMSFSHARAHATVVACDPPIGANLSAPPAQIVCEFTEPLVLESSSLMVFDAQGQRVDRGDTRRAGDDPKRLAVSLDTSKIKNGLYTVRWAVVDTIDAGVVQSEFQFGINTLVPPTPTPPLLQSLPAIATPVPARNFYSSDAPNPNEMIARFLIAVGVAVLGVIGFMVWRMRRAAQTVDEPESAANE